MIKATKTDYPLVIQILSSAFKDNRSVNYIVRQDHNRDKRIENLIAYSIKVCAKFGEIFLSDDQKACALILFPDRKKTTVQSLFWDINLIATCTGIINVQRTIDREAKIKQRHPDSPFVHLWYIGVSAADQGKGIGTKLLDQILHWADSHNRPVYLETSTESNIPFYRKAGFTIFDQLDLSYRLYFLCNKHAQNSMETDSLSSRSDINQSDRIQSSPVSSATVSSAIVSSTIAESTIAKSAIAESN
jgi:ribosomal protein S18 acetylase RimI-like enzyme